MPPHVVNTQDNGLIEVSSSMRLARPGGPEELEGDAAQTRHRLQCSFSTVSLADGGILLQSARKAQVQNGSLTTESSFLLKRQ